MDDVMSPALQFPTPGQGTEFDAEQAAYDARQDKRIRNHDEWIRKSEEQTQLLRRDVRVVGVLVLAAILSAIISVLGVYVHFSRVRTPQASPPPSRLVDISLACPAPTPTSPSS